MPKKLTLFICLCFTIQVNLGGWSGASPGPFLATLPLAKVVVKGKIIDFDYIMSTHYANLQVEKIYQGSTNKDTIKIQISYGFQYSFEEDNTYFIQGYHWVPLFTKDTSGGYTLQGDQILRPLNKIGVYQDEVCGNISISIYSKVKWYYRLIGKLIRRESMGYTECWSLEKFERKLKRTIKRGYYGTDHVYVNYFRD